MGITPSREDFVALEGYAQKSDEERRAILQSAGMEITDEDNQIAKFLGTEDEVLGCFIRGIIKTCIHLFNAQRTKEFNTYIEEYKTATNEMLQQKSLEINEWTRLKEEDWNRKEEYYFRHTNIKAHQIQTELGSVDTEDKEKMKEQQRLLKLEECRKKYGTSSDTDESISENAEWDNESFTSSDEHNLDERMQKQYYQFNKSSHHQEDNTPGNTNGKSRMQDETKNGNFQNSRDQSITMAYTADHDMGENSKKSKESMHKPKSTDDLKYFAGLFTVQIKDGQTVQSIIEYLNTNKILEYHVNTIGITTHHGNEYTYFSFFTETAKNNFIKDERVIGTIGKCRDLEWLNKMNRKLTLSITGIDEKYMDIDEVIKTVENKFGKMLGIKQQGKNGKMLSLKLEMEINCTEDELLNTWGILVKNRMIKVEPMNYKYHVIRQRGRTNASIMDIPNEIDDKAFTKLLKESGARFWFKVTNGSKKTYNIMVYFNNEEDRKRAIGKKIKIDNQIFTWFFQTNSRTNNNFQEGERHNRFNRRFQGQMYNRSQGRRIRCDICKKNNHTTDKCYFNKSKDNSRGRRETRRDDNDYRKYGRGRYDNEGNFERPNGYYDNRRYQHPAGNGPYNNKYNNGGNKGNRNHNNYREQQNRRYNNSNINTDNTMTITDTTTKSTEMITKKTVTTDTEIETEEDIIMADAIEIFKNLDTYNAPMEQEEKEKEKTKEKKEKNNNINNEKRNKTDNNHKNKKNNKKENNQKNKNKDNIKIGCINKTINDRRYKIEKIDGHVIKLDILFSGKQKNIRIIGIYNPVDDKIATESINKRIKTWIGDAQILGHEIIILGDFNESAKNKKKRKTLTTTIKNHDLQDVHECLAGNDMLDTWKSGKNSSRIDFIFTSDHILDCITSHEVLEIEDFETDHKGLSIKISIKEKLKINKTKYFNNKKKELNIIKLEPENWDEIADKVEERLLETEKEHINREEIWEKLTTIYDEEKKKIIKQIKKRREEKIEKTKKENKGSEDALTDEEKLENLINEYEKLEKIDKIEHGINKLMDKIIKEIWRKRDTKDYRYSAKEFDKRLIIEEWGTSD
ncbi:hypothetical protein RhiirA4_426625 [Rhizophagus irregularis]|uniref:Endonuclease/exonuclease/phosphatase domain-containing protein n=1 Tax=Rhizophagus irregularis TaxID=588596 RepID=A0A2I1H5R1_9GLOM|nr:hypothetical protein RhiirA4_426625 [Rhizophagus irregularis]